MYMCVCVCVLCIYIYMYVHSISQYISTLSFSFSVKITVQGEYYSCAVLCMFCVILIFNARQVSLASFLTYVAILGHALSPIHS